MKRCWDEQDLIEHWTLISAERALLANRTERGNIGVAVLVKFFQLNGRFPHHHKDVPGPVLAFIGEQLSVPPAAWFDYDLKGRSSQRDREQIRAFLGFRPITVADEDQLREWLQHEIVPLGRDSRHLRSAVAEWCRDHHLEPPSDERRDRLIGSAVRSFEEVFFAGIHDKLSEDARTRLDALIAPETVVENSDDTPDTTSLAFSFLKTDPGRIGLASVQREIAKLNRIRALDLPDGLWTNTSPKLLERYRSRAATESIRELRRHTKPVRYTLLTAFCWQRRRALDNPDGMVREVLFPLVGESTLDALVKESQAGGPTFRRRIQTLIHRSYAHHYRRMLPLILTTLVFRSNNRAHRPVIEALDWIREHRADHRKLVLCAQVPIEGVVRPQLQEILIEDGPDGERINRIDYEICALQALRERLRCKEIWVEGADRYRNPDEDLPVDFDVNRERYYRDLHQPRDPDQFIETLQQVMRNALGELDTNLFRNPKVRLRATGKKRSVLFSLEPQPEPSQLRLLKSEVGHRWPMTSLL